MRQATLIVNPFASTVTPERVAAVERELRRSAELRTLQTERPGHAVELAGAAAGSDAIYVYAGDGVYNEVLNGVDGTVPVGFLPGGGTNVLPRALGLPRDPVAAARRLADSLEAGRTRRISLGRVNGRRFATAAGVVFDAELVRRIDARGRARDGRRPGDLAFGWEAIRFFMSRRWRVEPEIEIEGFGRAAMVFVANCDPYSYAGRMPIHAAPLAEFELGLDLVAPRRLTPRNLPRIAKYAAAGGQERARDIVYAHDVDRIEIRCDRPLPSQTDGEDLGDTDHVVFEAERDAVSVLV